MSEDQDSIDRLFIRYLNNACTQDEVDFLLDHFKEDSEEHIRQHIERAFAEDLDFSGEVGQEQIRRMHPIGLEVRQYLRSQLATSAGSIAEPVKIVHRKLNNTRRIVATLAACLAVFAVSYLFFSDHRIFEDGGDKGLEQAVHILPGKHQALLMVGDREQIELMDGSQGVMTHAGRVHYLDGSTILADGQEAEMLTVQTPRGGQYQVVLPDATKVWLNAASSIRYPATFTGKERVIQITGEVYLEVSHHPEQPFIVESQYQRIEVLGTSFNLNTYGDQGNMITTLQEGSLRVTDTRNQHHTLLRPGQQARLGDTPGTIRVQEVQVGEVVSWKEGVYIVNNQPLSLFGGQIERWYDVEVDMGKHGNVLLSAIIPRNVPLVEVLEAIQLKTGLRFVVKERRVQVMD